VPRLRGVDSIVRLLANLHYTEPHKTTNDQVLDDQGKPSNAADVDDKKAAIWALFSEWNKDVTFRWQLKHERWSTVTTRSKQEFIETFSAYASQRKPN
jgi:hypothetical protein